MRTFMMLCVINVLLHFEIHLSVITIIALVVYFIVGIIQDYKEIK